MMMNEHEVLAQVRVTAEPLLAARGMELVELNSGRQGSRRVVRLLVYLPGGITLAQCAELNRALSAELDRVDSFEEPYLLEVASPGLDRPLVTRRDFERVQGETITAELREPFAGQRQLIGQMLSANDTSVTLETKRWGTVTLPLDGIVHASIRLQW